MPEARIKPGDGPWRWDGPLPAPDFAMLPRLIRRVILRHLTMPEFGVLYCLLDEAYALGQPSAELTLTTLVRDTGLARTSVSRALQALEAKGLIVKEKHNTPEHGWEATTYRVEITNDARYVNRIPSSAPLLASSDSGPSMARNATRKHDPSLPIDKKKKRSTDPVKYFSGDYALCPRCHERPCTCEHQS